MKKMVMVGVSAIALSGCANMNMGQMGGGRYYQQVSPVNDVVVTQMDAITDKMCQVFLAKVSPQDKQFFRCSSQSASAMLPWRAIMYNPYVQASFVIDANSFAWCYMITSAAVKEAEDNKWEGKLTMPCTEK